MLTICLSREKLKEMLNAVEKAGAEGIFYAPRKVVFHSKEAPLVSLFSLTLGSEREKELEKIKKEIPPVVSKEEGEIYPVVISLPLGFIKEDFKIAERGIEGLLEKIGKLAIEKGKTLDEISMEERMELLCEFMKEGKLTYDELFWLLLFHHALSGWSVLKKWNEQNFKGENSKE